MSQETTGAHISGQDPSDGSPMAEDLILSDRADLHDHDPEPEPRLRDLPLTIWNIPRYLVLGFIRGYQMTFSKTLPQGSCRFYPSCSHYGYQAIYKYGVVKGGLMAAWRIMRCNPFNRGGIDPVP